ncbi:uncharacterized protein LOC124273000 [Haliotis rubra]|uniref:uncharacterized protein LOC124273000 n=1 Tax=Haliotis rubra TaxID=36100 RepID=UPI001EE5628D|nr:uncharacterized protein LOC124273000 [Haliotis rubra]
MAAMLKLTRITETRHHITHLVTPEDKKAGDKSSHYPLGHPSRQEGWRQVITLPTWPPQQTGMLETSHHITHLATPADRKAGDKSSHYPPQQTGRLETSHHITHLATPADRKAGDKSSHYPLGHPSRQEGWRQVITLPTWPPQQTGRLETSHHITHLATPADRKVGDKSSHYPLGHPSRQEGWRQVITLPTWPLQQTGRLETSHHITHLATPADKKAGDKSSHYPPQQTGRLETSHHITHLATPADKKAGDKSSHYPPQQTGRLETSHHITHLATPADRKAEDKSSHYPLGHPNIILPSAETLQTGFLWD